MHLLAPVVALLLGTSVAEPDPITANQNRIPAGVLRAGVLTVALEAREGLWRPQTDAAGGVVVQAFGEVGKPLQIPGPLIRVRSGAKLQISLRNSLQQRLIVAGLRGNAQPDTLHIAPGATRTVDIEAGAPGTYYYWGTSTDTPVEFRAGNDSQLTGAFIVDPATGPIPADRIFVLGLWFSAADKAKSLPDREVMTINGKSWPDTERMTFRVGETVRWRWINATASAHPMHLHGFYFRVGSRGSWQDQETVPVQQQRDVATELMLAGTTMDIEWQAQREGNWVFHCHFAFHVSDELYLAPRGKAAHGDHGNGKVTAHSMAGLVLGIHVKPGTGPVAIKSSEAPRQMRLIAQQRSDTAYKGLRLGYALYQNGSEPHPDSMRAPGPLLVLRRGQPVAITVVNRLTEPTAVHWHGIELESFPDGVPGWSGTPARIMPPIAPQDSFVAEFVPPRAGTFIYHSHSNELGQILGGLVGPLVVLDNSDKLPENDRVFLISAAGTTPELGRFGLVNGQFELEPMTLDANKTYRFRFINIGDWRMFFTLMDDKGFPATRMIAKDGADLAQPVTGPLNMLSGPGETGDYEVNLPKGKYRLEFKQMLSGWIVPLDLIVR